MFTFDINYVHFWAKGNPHYYEELEHKTPHVMMWAALNARHAFEQYFFDTPVNMPQI